MKKLILLVNFVICSFFGVTHYYDAETVNNWAVVILISVVGCWLATVIILFLAYGETPEKKKASRPEVDRNELFRHIAEVANSYRK